MKVEKYGLPLILAAAVILISGRHGGCLLASASLALLACLCFLVLPLIDWVFGRTTIRWFCILPFGYLIHSFLLACCAIFFGFRPIVFIVYFIVMLTLSTLARFVTQPATDTFVNREWTRQDSFLLFAWLCAALVLVSLPFLRVGELTSQGYAFRAYFNTDVFRNMATAGSLTYTGIPPENPYFSGFPLHYYWLFHVLPAFWMTLLPSFPVESIFVQFALITGLMFVSVLFFFVRAFTTRRATLVLALPLFAFGGSYEGIYILNYLHGKHIAWRSFVGLNVDAILRWQYDMPQIDTLFRPLLYAPQHLMIVMIILLSILFWRFSSNRRIGALVLMVVLVLVSVGFSVILAGLLILGTAIALLLELRRNLRPVLIAIAAAMPLGAVFLYLYLKPFAMFSLHHGDLALGFNPKLFLHPMFFFVLNWGALLFLGFAGIYTAIKRGFSILLLFLSLAFFFIFLVQIDAPGLSDVSLKAGYVADSMLLTLSAILIDELLVRKKTYLAIPLVLALALPGIVTAYMDEYNSQDITNRKFTAYISKDQMEVFRWIRGNLDPHVRIQNYGSADPGFINGFVSAVPPFANRSVFLGDVILSQIFQTPKEELEERRKTLWEIMQSESVSMISILAQQAKIEYIVDSGGPDSPFRRNEASRYFKIAFSEGEAGVYRVMPVELEYEKGNEAILVKGDADVLLSAHYESNFYAPESIEGYLLSHWMSQDGQIVLTAGSSLEGMLTFSLQAMGKNRTMQVSVDNQPVLTQVISLSAMKVRFPVKLSPGNHTVVLHCVEGAESASVYFGGADKRQLSFRIWGLQFAGK